MTDVGTLSYEYERANEVAHALGAALQATDGNVPRQARAELRPLLLALVDLLNPLEASPTGTADVMSVPVGLALRLRDRDFHGQPISRALGELAATIADKGRRLSAEDMELLREVNGETEREVSTAFRRMVRR
jgi:hypothetical protein